MKLITLAELRRKNGITQKQLAEVLEISPSSVAMYEIGARVPSLKRAKQIADYFDLQVDEIDFFYNEHSRNASMNELHRER